MCRDCPCASLAAPAAASPVRSSPAPSSPAFLSLGVGRQLLERNDWLAERNRRRLRAARLTAVNLLSSPGSGKTSLLEALARLAPRAVPPPRLAALVGDLATARDASRLEAAGLPAVAISTGQACHLDAAMVSRGLDALEARGCSLASLDLLLIENVGNLV